MSSDTSAAGLEAQLRPLVRDIPDFPKPGILFRDLTPLMRDPRAWGLVLEGLQQRLAPLKPELIVGIEARGFLVGHTLAVQMGLGFVPVRKPGKLPGAVESVEYSLEYGTDRLEIVQGSLAGGPRVLVIDDLLATGGTAAACAQLVQQAGGSLCGFGFVAELCDLEGRQKLSSGVPVESLIQY